MPTSANRLPKSGPCSAPPIIPPCPQDPDGEGPGGAFTTVQVTPAKLRRPISALIALMGGASFQWKKSEIRNPFFAKCVLKLCKG